MLVGHLPPIWDVLTMAVAPHTGIPRCTILDARAGGIGNTTSTHMFPSLLGRVLVRTHLRHYAEG